MNLGGEESAKTPERVTVGERPRPRVNLKAIFGLEAGPWAWTTALQAAIAMTVSFALASVIFGPQIGTLAALGSMTVLYEKKTPYAYRAAALALVGLGFVAAVTVNSLAASLSPWAAVASIGLTAGVATWVCAAWRVDKPGTMFFVLVATISTIAPGGLAEVPLHALVAALGAAVGWAVSMSGAPLRARHPEYRAVAAAYRGLATLLRAVGTAELDHAQHAASVALAEAWRIVLLGQTRGYRTTTEAARLRALLRWVSDIHLAATQVCMARPTALPEEAADFADQMALAVADPASAPDPDSLDDLRRGMRPRSLEARLYNLLSRAAQSARRGSDEEENDDDRRTADLHDDRYPALWSSLRSSLSGDSLIRPTALRMWLTVTLAGAFGLSMGLDHYYWVALTTTAVLQGGNVVLTLNRSVQRSLGTLLGVLGGVALLTLDLPLVVVILAAGLLQGATQLVVGRNFFYGSVLLTPMALLLSYTANPYPVTELAGSRIIDTLVGSAFGLVGALLLWRRASATRLPQAIANVLASTRQCMMAVLDQDVEITEERRYRLRRDMRAALVSLRGVYDSAIGDVPRAASTRPLWPVVVATQRIGYLALAALSQDRSPNPAGTITLQRVDLAFHELISAMEERRTPRLGALPRLPAYPRINMELRALANSMTSAVAQDERSAQQEAERRAQRERRRAQKDVDADL
ncbi:MULTISPECIES: FUSC family protein [Nocardiopsis]|uniref:FUSC family protein n=1 Tax=Nocardiopsis TaxID=2013 RepID=UPI000376A1EB|nr:MULTISPECIES: FUSC family protein [Nocardiopsis]PWV55453.1 putative membrane protein YccC [Nocardiopsis sp. L17-MgMaSL7]